MSKILVDLTTKIRELFGEGKDSYRKNHIEMEKAYREILVAELVPVLRGGTATNVKSDTQSIQWQGRDRDRRLLELLITLYDENDQETLNAAEAARFLVGTAYEPNKNDDALRKQWLQENPDWEEGFRKTVRKKPVVEKKR